MGIMRSLTNKGYKVYALAPQDSYSAKLIAQGINFVPIKLNNYSMNPAKDIMLLCRLYLIYRKEAFGCVFHYTIKPNIYGSMAASLAKVPRRIIVVTGLGKMFRFKSAILHRLSLFMYHIAVRCSRQVWFLNEHDSDMFLRHGLLKHRQSYILPSEGVDINKYRSIKTKTEKRTTRFLFAGRLLFDKGIKEYAEAALWIKKRYPNVRFEILGFIDDSNPDAVSIDHIVSWQKQGIKYLGSTEDVRPYLDRCDCLVFPSYYQEGISRILLEAASMSRPIITTDNVGCRDVVIHGYNGLLCDKRSTDSLITVIQEFLSFSFEKRISMGDYGRRYIMEKFSEEHIIDCYMEKMGWNKISVVQKQLKI